MQPCWRCAAPRWRSARRLSGSAGVRRWSWLSPAVGLGAALRDLLGDRAAAGDGVVSAVAVLLPDVASVALSLGARGGRGEALRTGMPVALVALAAARCPSSSKGTSAFSAPSFNPDMSQHLLATDRLADGDRLAAADPGLPARPARDRRRAEQGSWHRAGPGIQRADGGGRDPRLADCPRRLRRPAAAAPHRRRPPRRPHLHGRLLLRPGLPSRRRCRPSSSSPSSWPCERARKTNWRRASSALCPGGAIAVGSIYTYSFPGLIWLIRAAAVWAALESRLPCGWRGGKRGSRTSPARSVPLPPRQDPQPRAQRPSPSFVFAS